MPITPQLEGDRFSVVRDGRRYATPLLLALVAVEVSDLIFAVDSIPAIFAVTTDPFIVFTSNIFAILGLRSLYFVLESMMGRFRHLKTALAFVLVFIGVKMLLHDVYALPHLLSLGVILGAVGLGVLFSLLSDKGAPQPEPRDPDSPEPN